MPKGGGWLSPADFEAFVNEAERRGWATTPAALTSIRHHASRAGWEAVPNRKGDIDKVSVLTPTTPDQARPKSLSAIHGLGAQPLHTDGAHLRQPPDFLVLASEEPNATPTLLWKAPSYGEEHAEGIFVVESGAEAFLTTAFAGTPHPRWRYDPGCMRPADQRAREAAAFFNEKAKEAVVHAWTTSAQVLLIDNRKTLHARAAIAEGDRGRVLHRIAFKRQEVQ